MWRKQRIEVFIGIGFGIIMPSGALKITDASPKSAATFANGLYMTAVNIGTVISPSILVVIANIAHNNDGQFLFRFCSILLLIGAVISLIIALFSQKTKSKSSVIFKKCIIARKRNIR